MPADLEGRHVQCVRRSGGSSRLTWEHKRVRATDLFEAAGLVLVQQARYERPVGQSFRKRPLLDRLEEVRGAIREYRDSEKRHTLGGRRRH